jgi:hypothetical protein
VESSHLRKVDEEARRILAENGWEWDPRVLGFRRLARRNESSESYERRQRIQPCPDVISLGELEGQRLYSEPQDPLIAPTVREAGLGWLRSRMEAAEPKL